MTAVPDNILRAAEARALREAVVFMTAGEADGVAPLVVEAAVSGQRKIGNAPLQAVWVPFSRAEIEVLLEAISNGAEGVMQRSSGNGPAVVARFKQAANRLCRAIGASPEY